jgi:dienelactone hydrolase
MGKDVSPDLRRKRLIRLLGGFSPTVLKITRRGALAAPDPRCRTAELSLATAAGEPVRGFLTGPEGDWQGLPAVLYCHAHGNRYAIGARELIDGRPSLQPEPYGPALARLGMVALCIDMPCFGGRAADSESALSKRMLWEGRTLFGRMLADLAGAFRLLRDLDGIDPARIGVFGFSMGATQAFWLGALEPRIARIAHACCFADLGMLVASGAHDLHGPYMTVPGLLGRFSTGDIAGLCAPRPQLALMGALDPLTPEPAIVTAVADARMAYAESPDAFEVVIDPRSGHVETPAMRRAVLDFLTGPV